LVISSTSKVQILPDIQDTCTIITLKAFGLRPQLIHQRAIATAPSVCAGIARHAASRPPPSAILVVRTPRRFATPAKPAAKAWMPLPLTFVHPCHDSRRSRKVTPMTDTRPCCLCACMPNGALYFTSTITLS